jgi:hypothetical protein
MFKKFFILLLFASQLGFAQSPTLTITEINYNSDSTRNGGDWFELYNYGGSAIDLSLYRLRDSSATGLYLVQPGVSIPAGGYLVFCTDSQAFDAIYNISNRIGNLGYGLNNKADGIRIYDGTNTLVLQVFYQDSLPWTMGADGWGRTLEITNTSADPTLASSWRTGCILGSPGAAFSPCTGETLVISEINYKSSIAENAGDWFEIRNIGNTTVNIGNYGVRNHKNELHYLIPSGTTLAPQGMVVVYNTPALFNTQFPFLLNKVGPFLFGLDGDGDAIRLYDATDKVIFSVYYDDDIPWDNQPDGFGYTLEADTNFVFSRDVCDGTNWFAGCPEGSPGKKYNPDCLGGLEENEPITALVYPNPSSDFVTVSGIENLAEWNLKLYSPLGQLISNSPQQSILQVANLAEGTYILEIATPTFTTRKKLMVSHE